MTTTSLLRLMMIATVGCKFIPGEVANLDAPSIDTPIALVDAGVCTMASIGCADPDTLRMCSGSGATAVDTPCSWGCLSTSPTNTSPHCGALVPSGGALDGSEFGTPGLDDITVAGTLDTSNGSISGLRASGVGVISNIDYSVVNSIAVFRFKSLHVIGAGLAVSGSLPAVLLSDGDIVIDGPLSASGSGANSGPGGGASGAKQGAGGDPGGGAAGKGTDPNNCGGGGGGGNGGLGGTGGTGGSAGSSTGGNLLGDMRITTLHGGGGGGGGGGMGAAGVGGGGAGGVQLVSNTSIMVNASIAANGGGGAGGNDGGGGGGAGGELLLEAPTITIGGGVTANGGGGGASNASSNGSDGTVSRTAAGGGTGGNNGGNGGTGGVAANANGGPGGNGSTKGAGGGGAIGWIRFDTKDGTLVLLSGALLSPALTDLTSATAGVAKVE